MGTVLHEAVIVTTWDHESERTPDVAAFREGMPEEYRKLLVGPIPSAVNGDVTWFFAPCGSKEGWGTKDECDQLQADFIALFSFQHATRSTPFEVVKVRYGSDQLDRAGGAAITYEQPHRVAAAVDGEQA